MSAVFGQNANLTLKMALLGATLLLVALICWWWFWPLSDYARHVSWIVEQPIPFSHEHHVAGLGVDCRFCHASVDASSTAGLPPTYTCMTCHSQIWTNAALLAPLRDSLASNKPIVWNRVDDLPDYVYFNHGIHIVKGVGCSSCHGEVDHMALTYKAKTLTMRFCLDCHRDPGPNLRPKDQIYNTEWRRTKDTPSAETLLAEYRIGERNLTDCSICHR